jgi:hypothetical protein
MTADVLGLALLVAGYAGIAVAGARNVRRARRRQPRSSRW